VKKARDERRTRGAQETRRAQMHLSHLRWLEGFASNGRWYAVDGDPAGIVLDGLTLSRARRSVNTLRRDHSEALAALVDDAEAWLATIDAVLTSLGRQIRGSTAPDEIVDLASPRVRKAARPVEAAYPALRPLVRAAVSSWILRPHVLIPALAWIRSRAQSLTPLLDGAGPDGLRRALQLARLSPDCEAGVDALLALMLRDVGDVQQAAARLGNLIGRLRGSARAPSAVPDRSKTIVMAWFDRLLERPAGDRARALGLLAAVEMVGAVDLWCAWEAEHASRIERALAFVDRGIERGPSIEHIRRLISGLERAQADLPPTFQVHALLSSLELLAEARHEPFHHAVVRMLAVRPALGSPFARAHFVRHAAEVAAMAPDDRRAAWLWEALAERAAGVPERVFDPWKAILAGDRHPWLEYELLEDAHRPVEVTRFAAALTRLAADLPISTKRARGLGAALAAGLDVDDAASLVCRLDPFKVRPIRHLVRAAIALAGQEVVALAGVLRLMCTRRLDFHRDGEQVLARLCEHAAAAGGVWLIGGLLEHDVRRLVEIVGWARVVPRQAWPTLEDDVPKPRWIAAYPAAFADSLVRLARVDPNAEQTARRRLAADLPDAADLEREAEALRTRLPASAEKARRLHALESRLSSPKPLSPARLQRLAAKLDAAAVRIGGARLAEALHASARARILAGLGLDRWPSEMLDRTHWSILVALTRLKPSQRALAARLLRGRGEPPPWDLRDDPVNRAFLDRLRAQGRDPSPWLDDASRVVTATDAQPLEIGFCGDPLEVFAMGSHFNTCLSPDGGNFFSVVTNAADINKRVLYARRNGAVVGRCLLALTDTGNVLAFHPYAHDHRLGFDAIVRDYASELAARMGSRVASAGRVALLLGSDWYDDGARDLVGRYEALARPELAAAMEDVAPSGLVELLEKALGRPIDDITLPLVLAMPALLRRPELIEPLVPHLLARPTLPDHTLLSAARLAIQIGDLTLASRLAEGPAVRIRLDHADWSIGEILARTHPSLTLARLRQSRPPGVRRWDQEHGERLAVAALALEHLHRPRQAAALYRRAIVDEPWLADELRPRLAALES
jgi:hypothetical protein